VANFHLLFEEEALLREVHPDVLIGTWQTGLKSAFDIAYRMFLSQRQPSRPARRGCVIN
jgi:hypothetical protein